MTTLPIQLSRRKVKQSPKRLQNRRPTWSASGPRNLHPSCADSKFSKSAARHILVKLVFQCPPGQDDCVALRCRELIDATRPALIRDGHNPPLEQRAHVLDPPEPRTHLGPTNDKLKSDTLCNEQAEHVQVLGLAKERGLAATLEPSQRAGDSDFD